MEDRPGTLVRMRLTRRQTLAGLGMASGALLLAGPAAAQLPASRLGLLLVDRSSRGTTRSAAEGPFYIDETLERVDITEGRPGLTLMLDLTVVEAEGRSALPGIRVACWHADADGCYSGFQGQGDERAISTVGRRFLRGSQFTDSRGKVAFATIYPGWYAGRTAHVHYKIFVEEQAVSVGQIYFPDDLNRFVFTTVPPYNRRVSRRDTRNRNDRVLARADRSPDVFAAIRMADTRLVASSTIAVNT